MAKKMSNDEYAKNFHQIVNFLNEGNNDSADQLVKSIRNIEIERLFFRSRTSPDADLNTTIHFDKPKITLGLTSSGGLIISILDHRLQEVTLGCYFKMINIIDDYNFEILLLNHKKVGNKVYLNFKK
ncbi:hypothetical protein HN385_05985 [archaeon]|jgi:hypothetical protein|nr:hypothetical protein [archaeon]MBT3451092.1 hypothetical protein [archaeon]MBT6868664.1 hypothetical protein [archaeon]MBT7193369.1 hypothetical protein [archaeon]MBT7381461.1 hypothetical protein [archaeon]